MVLLEINSTYTIITAIATAITAVVGVFSIKNERKKRQLSLFSESIRAAMDGVKNTESLDYIMSRKFDIDIETVKRYRGLKPYEDVGLCDFKEIVINGYIKEGLTIDKDTKENLRKAYKKIKYFCDRMEYLGVIAEDKAACKLIIGYFKHNIIDTYKKLEPLIKKTREEEKDENLYMHYTSLYTITLNLDKK